MKNLYEILDVSSDASPEKLKDQWRFLVHAWHPDKFPNPAQKARAEQQIKEINNAYETLSRPDRRAQYDRERSAEERRKGQATTRPESTPKPPDPVVRIAVLSIGGSVSRAGNRYRFQIRIEGDNEGNCTLGWSGVTINVPTINSRDRYLATEIQMSSIGCNAPSRYGPEDEIWGFLDDGSFSQKPAACLLMECVREEWPPHERIALEAVLFASCSRLDAQLRVWSNRPPAKSGTGFGDPDWKTTKQKDQQGIPAYPLSLGFD